MHTLKKIREMLMVNLTDATEKPMTTSNLDVIDKLTHSIKSIDTIMAMHGYKPTEEDKVKEDSLKEIVSKLSALVESK